MVCSIVLSLLNSTISFIGCLILFTSITETVTTIRRDSGEHGPVPPIYTFTFDDGFYVALSKNVADRYSKYDGKLFSVWETKHGYVKTHEVISADELPDNITVDELYVDDDSINEAHLEAIAQES